MDSSGFTTRLASLIDQASGVAIKNSRRILVSLSERVPIRDPLGALETCCRTLSAEMQLADHLHAGMAYWARPSQSFAIAAIGAAAVLSPTGAERFASIDDEWRWILSNALIESDSRDLPSVGPILIGGFSFDPEGPRTERWRGFPSAHMIVPQMHLSAVDGESWLTVSAVVDEKNQFSAHELEQIGIMRDAILSTEPAVTRSEGSLIEISDDLPGDEWRGVVREAVADIRANDLRKVVLARSIHGTTSEPANAFAVLRELSTVHQEALIFGYWRDEKAFVGASPERLAQLAEGTISASSLAGTVRRGTTTEEDASFARELQSSTKDLAEHAAVRDMLHEILSEVAENVTSPDAPEIVSLSNVHHLHTEVRADLCDHRSLLDVVSRLHPTPAVGGTPRDRALEFIRQNERLDRGWYAAPIGWLDRNGGEFAVALRCGVIDANKFALYAGCGIVADSDPDQELAESNLKLEPMRSAIAESFEDAESAVGVEQSE
jgi:isochorismate synthase